MVLHVLVHVHHLLELHLAADGLGSAHSTLYDVYGCTILCVLYTFVQYIYVWYTYVLYMLRTLYVCPYVLYTY